MSVRWYLFIGCALIAAASVPLVLRLVGPNRWYGFSTPRTMASRAAWFDANVIAGRWLLGAAAAGGAAMWFGPPRWMHPMWLPALIVLVPVGLAMAATAWQVRRMAGHDGGRAADDA